MAKTDPIRVFLVDDHPVLRDGFRELVENEEDFTVAGEASSGEEALEKLSNTEAHLVVVDISLGGMNGIELTRQLKETDPDVHVLVISMYDGTHYVENALEAGAGGYVLKDNVHTILPEAIRKVCAGELYLDAGLEYNSNH